MVAIARFLLYKASSKNLSVPAATPLRQLQVSVDDPAALAAALARQD